MVLKYPSKQYQLGICTITGTPYTVGRKVYLVSEVANKRRHMARKRTIATLPQEELRRLFYLEQKRSLSRKESLELFKLQELYQKAVEEGNTTETGDDGGV